MSHKRYALAYDEHRSLSLLCIVFTTGVTEGALVAIDSEGDELEDTTSGTSGVVTGLFAGTGLGVMGATIGGDCTGPDPTLMKTVPRHTGCPVRADRSVTCKGRVPRIGVVSISAWIRTDPEASIRRLNLLNESELSPTDPKMAT